MNPAFVAFLSKREQRLCLEREAAARKSGDWGAWSEVKFPKGTVAKTGWPSEITHGYRNQVFMVLVRDLPGGVTHLAITSASEIRPTWPEMQRIKNAIIGTEATAVEVYPPQFKVVDAANMYHIWVLPQGLPFGLADEELKLSEPETVEGLA